MRFALLSLLAAALCACSNRDAVPTDLGPDASRPDASGSDLGAGTDAGDVDGGGGDDAGSDGGPDCTGLTTCPTSGLTCDGNTLVVCGRNPAGCLVANRTDCTTVAGGFCTTMGGTRCTVDRCVGLPTACPTAGRMCTGDNLVICAPDSLGCLVSTTEDCTSIGSTCLPMPDVDGGVGPAACSAPAPCFGVPPSTICTTAGRTCDTATMLTDCHANATGCLVATHTDCAAGGSPLAHCDATMTPPSCYDPCAGLTLCAPADPASRCVGARIVNCVHDAAGCYVETRTNCGTMGMGCDASSGTGMCSGTLCPAMAGTLSCTGRTLPYTQSGDTSTESSVLPRNSCAPGVTYLGNEGIWTFTSDVAAVAHITAHPISDTTHPFDVFVLDGTATPCDTGSACTTSATAFTSGVRNVDFAVLPGERYYVVYDGTDATATTTYTMLITCDLCGDSVVSPPEQCDDGNLTAGDGCSANCQPEVGWACSGSPSTCHRTVCGNGIIEPGESCDDSNTTAGDGCSPTCRVEGATPLAARGGTVMATGTLGGMTWTRPDQPCSTPGTSGVSYAVTWVENTGATSLTISVNAVWGSFGDGYLFAYTPPFDPTMPALGCLTGNDDSPSAGITESFISGVTVPPGAQIAIVASEFDPGSAAGAYTLMIQSM